MASGHGYSLDTCPPYAPTDLREPGYIFFLYLIYKIFGHNIQIAYFIQILFFSASCVLVFLIAKEIANARVAGYAGILTAVCPTLANYAIYLYSESFFTFLLIFSIFALINAKNSQLVKWYILSGLLLGLMVLCKAVMLFFIVPAICYLFNKNYKKIVLLFILFLSVIIPWTLRNYYTFGTFSFARRAEMNLLIRAYKTDYSFDKMKKTIIYSYSEYLGSRYFPDPTIKPRDILFQEDYKAYDKYAELVKKGKSSAQINKIMAEEAFYRLKGHPVKYLLQTPVELFRMALFMHMPALWEKNTVDKFTNIQGGTIFLSVVRGLYRSISFVILALSFIGIYIRRAYWKKDFIILAAIIYINLIYSILNSHSRYSMPLIPFYLMFAVIGVVGIFNRKKDLYGAGTH